jgi:hypothetical protein
MRDPYAFLPKKFKEAVARGQLHVYCEFCVSASRVRGRCTAGVADPVAAWRDGECPWYAEAEGCGCGGQQPAPAAGSSA